MPPDGGWTVRALPSEGKHLQEVWNKIRPHALDPTHAVSSQNVFLEANGLFGLEKKVELIGKTQWCDLDPWRCKQGKQRDSEGQVKDGRIAGARKFWGQMNLLMTTIGEGDAKALMQEILDEATVMVNRPAPRGCPVCAGKWATHLAMNPLPEEGSREVYRRYLVLMHNLTREDKPPAPYEFVAEKFGWID